jgi:hypothetical protein
MPRIRVDLDTETYERLLEVSMRARRPVPWHAEVLIRQALGLPFPYPEVVDVVAEPAPLLGLSGGGSFVREGPDDAA